MLVSCITSFAHWCNRRNVWFILRVVRVGAWAVLRSEMFMLNRARWDIMFLRNKHSANMQRHDMLDENILWRGGETLNGSVVTDRENRWSRILVWNRCVQAYLYFGVYHYCLIHLLNFNNFWFTFDEPASDWSCNWNFTMEMILKCWIFRPVAVEMTIKTVAVLLAAELFVVV